MVAVVPGGIGSRGAHQLQTEVGGERHRWSASRGSRREGVNERERKEEELVGAKCWFYISGLGIRDGYSKSNRYLLIQR